MDGTNGGQWRSVRDGLFRLFSHIPLGAEVAIVTFGSKARVNIEPTVRRDCLAQARHTSAVAASRS